MGCRSNFTDKPNPLWLQHVIITLYSLIVVISTVANAAVIYSIIKLKLYNRTMIFVLLLSFADLGVSAIGMPLCLTVFIQTKQNCNLDMAAEFSCLCFGHLIAYITAIVGYDCYCSMKYLTEYQRIVRRWKVYVSLATAFFLSFFRSGIHTLGVMYDKFSGLAIKIGIGADLFVLLLMLPPYCLAAYVVRRHVKNRVNQHLLSKDAQPVNAIAFRRVIAAILLYIPIILLALLNRYLPKDGTIRQNEVYLFMWSMSYGLMGLSSFVNAVIFISLNVNCRRQIRRNFSHKRNNTYSNAQTNTKESAIMGRIDISGDEVNTNVETLRYVNRITDTI